MAGTITALVTQARNKERVNVFVDGEFVCGLALIEALKLHKGQYLTDDEIVRLHELDEIEVAHESALNFLSYRPRSVQEVRRKLAEKFSPTAREIVIGRLEQAGLLSDEAFALYWVENREQFGPRSARALRFELRQKGVPDTVIASALADLNESEAAYRAAVSQARRYRDQNQATFARKLGDFLVRRGFNYSTAKEAIQRLWDEGHSHNAVGFADDLDMD